MANIRSSKDHIYNAVSGEGSYYFDALSVINDSIFSFPGTGLGTTDLVAIPVSAAGSSILITIPIVQDCVIARVMWSAAAVTSVSTSDVQINFQVGPPTANFSGAYTATFGGTTGGAAVGVAQTATTAGRFLFAKSPNFYTVNAGTTLPVAITAVPDIPEAFYTTGQTICVQVITGTSGGVTFPMTVALLVAPVDRKPTVSTANPSSDF